MHVPILLVFILPFTAVASPYAVPDLSLQSPFYCVNPNSAVPGVCPLGFGQSWSSVPSPLAFTANASISLSFTATRLDSRFLGTVLSSYVIVCREGTLACAPSIPQTSFMTRFASSQNVAAVLNQTNLAETFTVVASTPYTERITFLGVTQVNVRGSIVYAVVSFTRQVVSATPKPVTVTSAVCTFSVQPQLYNVTATAPDASSPVLFEFAYAPTFASMLPPPRWQVRTLGDMRSADGSSLGAGFNDPQPLSPRATGEVFMSLNGPGSIVGLGLSILASDGSAFDSCVWEVLEQTNAPSPADPFVDTVVCVTTLSRSVGLVQSEPNLGLVLRYALGLLPPGAQVSLAGIPLTPVVAGGATTGAISVAQLPSPGSLAFVMADGVPIDHCVVGRGPRSLSFPREFRPFVVPATDTWAGSDPLVLGATCDFESPQAVLGFARLVLLTDLNVRVSYSLAGLPQGPHALSLGQLGDVTVPDGGGLMVPTLPPAEQCLNNNCQATTTPIVKLGVAVANQDTAAISGVLPSVLVRLNGRNDVVGRSVRVHAGGDVTTPVLALCVVGITAESSSLVGPSRVDMDTRFTCRLSPWLDSERGSGMVRFEELRSLGSMITRVIYAVANLNETISFKITYRGDLQLFGQVDGQVFPGTVWPLLQPSPNDGMVTGSFDLPGTGVLLGRSLLVIGAAHGAVLSRCVIGVAQPVPNPISTTFAPTTPQPTLPFGQTARPVVSPTPPPFFIEPQSEGTSSLAAIIVVTLAFLGGCLFLAGGPSGLLRRYRRMRAENEDSSAYQRVLPDAQELEMSDREAPPPLPPKPATRTPLAGGGGGGGGDDDDDNEQQSISLV